MTDKYLTEKYKIVGNEDTIKYKTMEETFKDQGGTLTPKEKPFQFQVGDKVSIEGELISNESSSSTNFPMVLRTNGGLLVGLCQPSGRLLHEDAPSLKLISRPKKKVKKTLECWVNFFYYNGEISASAHKTREAADYEDVVENMLYRLRCEKFTTELEVEEE